MPIADVMIVRDGGDDAPFDVTLPQGAALQPVAVNAAFDGTGAGGDFIPAVVLLSPSGVVIARAADPANVVSAGSSAEGSWFPGVKNAAAGVTPSGGGGVAWAYTKSAAGGQSIGSGLGPVYFSVQDTGGLDRFETSDAGVFANASTSLFTGSPVWGIQINSAGTYMVQGAGFWIAQGTTGRGISFYYSASNGSAPSIFQSGRTDSLTGDNWSHAAAAPGLPHMSYYEFLSVAAGQVGAVLAAYASVQSGGASTVQGNMMVFKLSDYVATEL